MTRALVAGIFLLFSLSNAVARSHPPSVAYETRTFARNGEEKMIVACRTLVSIEFVLMELLRNVAAPLAIGLANTTFIESPCHLLHDPLFTLVRHEKTIQVLKGFEVQFYLAHIERGERYYMWTAQQTGLERETSISKDSPSQ